MLIEPALHGGDKLYIVSGYATPAMAFHHMDALRKKDSRVSVELIVGMCAQEGLAQSHHLGFKRLVERDFKDVFKCSYLTKVPPVHAKVYAWFRGSKPVIGFAGSANYTQQSFGPGRREFVVDTEAAECLAYFQRLVSGTIYCEHPDADREITIYDDRTFEYAQRMGRLTQDVIPGPETHRPEIAGLPSVTISLLDAHGSLPPRSGLNWGQRPEQHREPNQAYIRLPSSVYNKDFFPPRKEHFTVITDDSQVLICTRAQDNGKAIETPHNNSLIGIYFRNRLGLASGQRVQTADLRRYGRTNITFTRVDPETYYMDFSVPKS
jgi:hypothetical protein